jgi:hypothetical protein
MSAGGSCDKVGPRRLDAPQPDFRNKFLREVEHGRSRFLGGFIEERVLAPERFNTVIGVLLLVIMLLSPDGIAGIIARVRDAFSRGGDRPGGDGTDRRDDSAEALNSQTTGNHTMEGTIP